MDLHGNAALSWSGRRELLRAVVVEGWTLTAAAEAAGVSVRCARKWVGRYRLRATAVCSIALRRRGVSPIGRAPERIEVIVKLRRLRMTAAEIAETLGMPLSTVSGILTRVGLGRLGRLGLEPPVRYERSRPGELVHLDVKKLGRVDGASATASAATAQANEDRYQRRPPASASPAGSSSTSPSTTTADSPTPKCSTTRERAPPPASSRRAVAFYRRHGIRVERVLTDNGACYRSIIHALACRQLGIRHLRTRPYRPQTNGKAERFIRTLLNGWAYGAIYGSSHERTAALDGWLWHYNHRRRHSALGHQPPITRTNLLGSYS